MNWRVWSEIEIILDEANIKPIMAVVPDNQDPRLSVDSPISNFWEKVRKWQSRGWCIALHGYQHVYVNKNPGILLHPNRKSEFAGLTREAQSEKLTRGLNIFCREGVKADCWVAPAHTFDWTTVDLLNQLGVKVISDGFWPWPYTDKRGMTWIPHQLSSLVHKKSGVWGVGYHINSWNRDQVILFHKDVDHFASSITSLSAVMSVFGRRRLRFNDKLNATHFLVWYCWIAPLLQRSSIAPLLRHLHRSFLRKFRTI
jgi:peptidoglycan/xylan/chitin deacetylase (PgdA/CDA1 family)